MRVRRRCVKPASSSSMPDPQALGYPRESDRRAGPLFPGARAWRLPQLPARSAVRAPSVPAIETLLHGRVSPCRRPVRAYAHPSSSSSCDARGIARKWRGNTTHREAAKSHGVGSVRDGTRHPAQPSPYGESGLLSIPRSLVRIQPAHTRKLRKRGPFSLTSSGRNGP
jgi:hypothetical protein